MGYLVTVENLYLMSERDVFMCFPSHEVEFPNTHHNQTKKLVGAGILHLYYECQWAYPSPPQSSPPQAAGWSSYQRWMFSCVLLTTVKSGVHTGSVCWHILYHLSHLNHWRQGEVHIKDRGFHVFSYIQGSAELRQPEPVGISFTTSVISTSGGSTKFISNMDVFMCSPSNCY